MRSKIQHDVSFLESPKGNYFTLYGLFLSHVTLKVLTTQENFLVVSHNIETICFP